MAKLKLIMTVLLCVSLVHANAYGLDTDYNVTVDDGSGNSPSFVARDASNEELILNKVDGGGAIVKSTQGPIAIQPSGNTTNYLSAETVTSNPTLWFSNALSNKPGVRLNDTTGQLSIRDKNATTWQNIAWTVSSKTANFSITSSDDKTVFLVSNQVTASLPAAATVGSGFMIAVKRVGASTVTITPNGSETIDGGLYAKLNTQYAKVTLISDGSNWYQLDTYGTVSNAVTCPTGYVLVPQNATYVAADFCVAKYHMKNVSSVATSQAGSTPWVSIDQTAAKNACTALGTGYHLITNNEWMTIARNIENTASNWSGGAVGSGAVNRGHTDNSPANALVAVSDDNDACNGTGQTCSSTVWNDQRRTYTLSNGQVIWDMSGNVWTWVDWNVVTDKANSGSGWIEINTATPTTAMPQTSFYPQNSSYTSTHGMGLYYPGTNGSGGAALRGGGWNDGTGAGVFNLNLNNAPSNTGTYFGFRCGWSG